MIDVRRRTVACRLEPEIKELYEKWHGGGLEVIGVNFDHEPENAKKTRKLLGLAWPQVFVPDDEATRQLWQEATGIGTLPRVLLPISSEVAPPQVVPP